MSRCFAYQRSSGSLRIGSTGDAVVVVVGGAEPIKPQRQGQNAILEDSKRDKKEGSKDGKERKVYKASRIGVKADNGKKAFPLKRKEEEVERSDLTEEHEQPVSTQTSCYLSDGSQGSNKRKRVDQPTDVVAKKRNIIRIRLPLKRNEESNGTGPQSSAHSWPQQKETVCTPSLGQQRSTIVPEIPCKTEKKDCTSGPEKPLQHECATTSKDPWNDKMLAEEFLYKSLIEDWVPPPLKLEDDSDDQEWLFGTKGKGRQASRGFKANTNVSWYDCSNFGPRACYLPEVDICALPYTTPF